MGIKVVKSRGRAIFEAKVNALLADGFKIETILSMGDMNFAAVLSNGVITEGMNSKEIDSAYEKECNELKKTVKLLEKEKDMLQDGLADAQNKYAEALSGFEKNASLCDELRANGADLISEIAELKKELATCKGQNTKLENKIKKLIED